MARSRLRVDQETGTLTSRIAAPVAACIGVRRKAAGPPSASSAKTVVSQSTVAECAAMRRSANAATV